MSDSLQEKSIVIIGGTTGLGLSAAQAFVNAGARVVLVGRSADSADAALKLIGSEARALVADATLSTTAVTAIDLSLQHFGGFDGLYHVAGGSGRRPG
jgi:NAD(P)-dependent dehydrogenase (short-subunit alcohol dehydrogenase family)